MQQKLENHNSFVRRPVHSVFNGTETLPFPGPKICNIVLNKYNCSGPPALKCQRYRVYCQIKNYSFTISMQK